MLGALNDLCLHLRGEARKVITVAANAHDKITVRIGILLCTLQ